MLMCNGCSGFAGDGDETTGELVTATLSDEPCKAWNVIFTFVLGNLSVHLANNHRSNTQHFHTDDLYEPAKISPVLPVNS